MGDHDFRYNLPSRVVWQDGNAVWVDTSFACLDLGQDGADGYLDGYAPEEEGDE